MAVGDVVSGISANNTTLNFQPAAGVEIMLTAFSGGFGGGITDGVVIGSSMFVNYTETKKIFITNTNYITIAPGGAGFYGAYTGIQIK
jgi:hypothetical protein